MPRGPGKSSNYNLDYSRFNAAERSEDDQQQQQEQQEMPEDFAAALKNMPPELQEAYRLAMISRSTGSKWLWLLLVLVLLLQRLTIYCNQKLITVGL